MNTSRAGEPSRILQLLRSCCVLGALALSLTGRAEPAAVGTISGTVRNAGTGEFLNGAEVRIVGADLVTTTQRDGRFTLSRVPAGSQRVRVFYTGLDPQESAVAVTPGEML